MGVRHIVTTSELGPVTIVADGTTLTGVYFPLPTAIPDGDGDPIQLSVWDLVTRVQHNRSTTARPRRVQ